MYKLFALLLLVQSALCSEDFSMSLTESGTGPKQVRLEIDMQIEEIPGHPLNEGKIYNEVATQLELSQIFVKQDPSLPKLVIRVKSVLAVPEVYASFVQVAFFEEAILRRTESPFMATTWSRGTLIVTSKNDCVPEIMNNILSMVKDFILDYQKAFLKT